MPGLNRFPADEWSDPQIVFWTFRIVASIGWPMLAVAVIHSVLRFGGRIYRARWLQWFLVGGVPVGFAAILFNLRPLPIPAILGYTAYSCWVFGGKVTGGFGYH